MANAGFHLGMKKGYFFSIDAVLAIVILAGGLIFLFSSMGNNPDILTPKHLSTDLMGLLFDVKISDICEGPMAPIPECQCIYVTIEENYYCRGEITNTDFTLLEFFGMLYQQNPTNIVFIGEMINDTITSSNLVPKNYNFTFLLTDHSNPGSDPVTLYPLPP